MLFLTATCQTRCVQASLLYCYCWYNQQIIRKRLTLCCLGSRSRWRSPVYSVHVQHGSSSRPGRLCRSCSWIAFAGIYSTEKLQQDFPAPRYLYYQESWYYYPKCHNLQIRFAVSRTVMYQNATAVPTTSSFFHSLRHTLTYTYVRTHWRMSPVRLRSVRSFVFIRTKWYQCFGPHDYVVVFLCPQQEHHMK